MKIVIQRVKKCHVEINNRISGSIGHGLLLFLGIEEADTAEDAEWLAQKVIQMRIFSDTEGKMNLDVRDVSGELLVVSQFTLHALTKKGNRPSFIRAARPEQAIPMYEKFILLLTSALCKPIATGEFGADMQVHLVNDGPVTILLDSKAKE
jgi:D-tyrosyl-tRNA(Tyr) deacylase